jgi:hypothetical protein
MLVPTADRSESCSIQPVSIEFDRNAVRCSGGGAAENTAGVTREHPQFGPFQYRCPLTRKASSPMTIMIRRYAPQDWDDMCRIHDAARLDELRNSVGVEAFLPLAGRHPREGRAF